MAAGCGIHAIGYSLAVTEPISNSARLAAQPIAGGGTPVDMWIGWGSRLASLNFDHCPALILVAAHPDDETLGLGATAAMLAHRGIAVQVVAVTDGEAAYPEDPHGREKLAQARRDELITASACLRLPRPIFLGIPDGEVAANEDRLEVELEAVLAESQPGAWCAATWRGDGHPDHEATGRAAAAASKDVPAVFIEYPVWMWHWALPDDPAVSWDSARRVSLTPRDLATKTKALQCFSSQLERTAGPPLLPTAVVERQLAVGEIVFV
jgi:LmbE family N-acetylglucosaminyl deacetylase